MPGTSTLAWVTALVVVVLSAPCAPAAPAGECERQHRLVAKAIERAAPRVDVDGDGRLDTVAAVTDPRAGTRCRAFVAVRVRGDRTYSARLDASAVPPPGFRATLIGFPDLGNDRGAEIVVDSHAMADAALSQLFTLARRALVRVAAPGRRDGNLVVEGGGVTHPKGASCTAQGALVVSRAVAQDRGARFDVTRRIYPVRGERLRMLAPRTLRASVPAQDLVATFPELVSPHFADCTDRVRRARTSG